jgi:hypothetical protein
MHLVPNDEQNVAASMEFTGSAAGKIQEDALVLDEDAHGRVRLLYETIRPERYLSAGSTPVFLAEHRKQLKSQQMRTPSERTTGISL